MNKINFMLGIHNHQPIGNFDHVFEESYQTSYLPFLSVLKKYPSIRATMHFTGPLWEWIDLKHPEYFELLHDLIESNQIEFMGGGFYEPILTVLPEMDAIGQIDKMTNYIKTKFKQTPSGFWLAERVWEPSIAGFAKTNNMKYTLLDESHFMYSGLLKDQIHGSYITEDKGNTMYIFPISYDLRYYIPFKEVSETEKVLRNLAEREDVTGITFADDGEKFGVWPGTFKWVYEEQWLDKFFGFLEDNQDWIEMPFFSEYIEKYKPEGRVYIPTASYAEMSEWALPAVSEVEYEKVLEFTKKNKKEKEFEPYIRGGFWRNFQAIYDESNNMHKKSLLVSEKAHKIKDNKKKKEALDYLWKGQCNCPYWHGIFGGLYLNSLRFATYRNLIMAEAIADNDLQKTKAWKEITEQDFDKDGYDEILVNTDKFNLYISPSAGGSIFELDYKPINFNFSDILSRRPEAYHEKVKNAGSNASDDQGCESIHGAITLKEDNIEKYLIYDEYRRASLIDHILCKNTKFDKYKTGKHEELADFYKSGYTYKFDEKKGEIVLERENFISISTGSYPIKIRKTINFDKNSSLIDINYILTNKSDKKLEFLFGIDFVFTLLAGNAPDRKYYIPGHEKIKDVSMQSEGSLDNVFEVQAIDDWLRAKLVFNFNKDCRLWRFPIQTVSQSEGGVEKNYQGSLIFPNWQVCLEPCSRWSVKIKKEIVSWA